MSHEFGPKLAATLDFAGKDIVWTEADLADILTAQLDQQAPAANRTIRSMLCKPTGVEDLDFVKTFAKELAAENTYPRQVAQVLYIAAIEAARSQFGSEISSLTEESQTQIRTWALEQDWLGPDIMKILQNRSSN